MEYDFHKIENKWRKVWKDECYVINKTSNSSTKPKKYILDMFPYPSGNGLHVGHIEGYTGSDILSRYYRMQGFNVLHPMGYDSFGLPAEQYAMKNNISPKKAVDDSIKNFQRQLELMGFSYDWDRVIKTSDPEYFKWTQWIFLKLYEAGLAYEKEMPVNYCPECGVVLANEEVHDGKCFRCDCKVERKNIKQWMLKITDYAERLLSDLDSLNWSDKIKTMQKNWIGKSSGYEVKFLVPECEEKITVFTTRIDTLFGVTYLVLSPEHPLVEKICEESRLEYVREYIKKASQKTDLERQFLAKEKTGEFLGVYAKNPATNKEIPIYISDYVLMNYGTGAIMAVPAHDERDFDFAKKFDLDVVQVIERFGEKVKEGECYCGEGYLINSGPFNDRKTEEARDKIALFVGANAKTNYKLRDWVFSRQRYWGEPIPLIHCPKCGTVALKESDLPLELPKLDEYRINNDALSPLASIESWVNVKCPVCGEKAKREVNTMPQWAGSCWYYLRYISPDFKNGVVSPVKEKYFMPVDLYIGGTEHAVSHLIYSRFWHKFLYDLGVVSTKEPFMKLINQGIVLGEDGEKMSKSKGNVVNPDDIVERYGADTLRVYEMFMGPFEDMKPWNDQNILGVYRFLEKIFILFEMRFNSKKKTDTEFKEKVSTDSLERSIHKAIKKVSSDIEEVKFNTAISCLMELVNDFYKYKNFIDVVPEKYFENLALLLAPFAPFLSEELWVEFLKKSKTIHKVKWPEYDEKLIVDKKSRIVIQINGKVRDTIEVNKDISQEMLEEKVMSLKKINAYLEGQKIKKVIYIDNKLINFVI